MSFSMQVKVAKSASSSSSLISVSSTGYNWHLQSSTKMIFCMPVPEKEKKRSHFNLCKTDRSLHTYRGYQRTFSHCMWRNTLVLACHYKDETETGNCAWKVSGTQGIAQTLQWKKAGNVLQNRCERSFVFTFLVLDLLLKIIKAWESLKQIIYTHVPCTSDIMPKWTWLSLESFTGKKIWFTDTPTIFKYIHRSLLYLWKPVTSHGRKAY